MLDFTLKVYINPETATNLYMAGVRTIHHCVRVSQSILINGQVNKLAKIKTKETGFKLSWDSPNTIMPLL